MGQDEAVPGIVGAFFGFIIAELQGGMAYATMQVHPLQIAAGVKMVQINIPYVAGGVYQAIRGVCGDAHGAPKVANKKAKGTPLAGIASGIKSVTCHLKVNLYLLDEV